MLTLLLCFILALVFSLYFVPIMRRAAIKWGVVDKPDGRLKFQKEPVAYLGGIAIYLAFLLSISLVYDFSPEVLGLLLSGTVMLLIGLVDDFGVLSPYQKFAGQFLAIFVLIKAGIYIKVEFFPIWLAIPLTVFWMLGIINAVNIVDVSDGLSGGTSFITCIFLMIVALFNGNTTIAVLTAGLAGSILGFLVFNFHPAKIYLGDAGSLFIGLMLAALSMIADYSKTNPLAYIAPILLLGIPIFDTFFVMLMRAKKGLPVFLGSPDHFAIRLKKLGMTTPQVAILSYVVAATLGGVALFNMTLEPVWSAIILSVMIIITIVVTIWMNGIEK